MFKFLKKKKESLDLSEFESSIVSYTVKWGVEGYYGTRYHHKTFVIENDAKKFKLKIEECAKFIGANVITEIIKSE